jgi:hypothetical protein
VYVQVFLSTIYSEAWEKNSRNNSVFCNGKGEGRVQGHNEVIGGLLKLISLINLIS